MSEAVRQELRELYMGRIDTYPYYFYPVRRMGGMGGMDRPMMPLPTDLMNPDPRKYLFSRISRFLIEDDQFNRKLI